MKHLTHFTKAVLVTSFSVSMLLAAAGPSAQDINKYDADSQYRIAKTHINLNNDYAQAFPWLKAAAESGHATAQCTIALFYMNGVVVKQNEAEAIKWYRAAAYQGSTYGQSRLGDIYANKQDHQAAIEWYTKAAEAAQPDTYAQRQLGLLHLDGTITPPDLTKGLALLEAAANQDDTTAQCILGLLLTGIENMRLPTPVPLNSEEGIKWLTKAAAAPSGIAAGKAAYLLGAFYTDGNFVQPDLSTAVQYFMISAQRGYMPGIFAVATSYLSGKGVEKSTSRAIDLLTYITATAGTENEDLIARSAFLLGKIYCYGIEVETDSEKGVNWLLFAMNKGNTDAPYELGSILESQGTTDDDFAQAQELYERAAKGGNAQAAEALERLKTRAASASQPESVASAPKTAEHEDIAK